MPALTEPDLGSALWASFFILMLGAFVRKTWFGWDLSWRAIRRAIALLRRPQAAWSSIGLDAGATRREAGDCDVDDVARPRIAVDQ